MTARNLYLYLTLIPMEGGKFASNIDPLAEHAMPLPGMEPSSSEIASRFDFPVTDEEELLARSITKKLTRLYLRAKNYLLSK